MVHQTSVDILFISLLVLFVILVVLVVLFWVYRHFKDRSLTLLKISVGQPPLQLAIRTKPEHAQDLMDHLLERFALQAETATVMDEASQEHVQENVTASKVTSDLSKIPDRVSKKMTQWLSMAIPSWQTNKIKKNQGFHSGCDESQDEPQPTSSSSQPETQSVNSNMKRREEETLV